MGPVIRVHQICLILVIGLRATNSFSSCPPVTLFTTRGRISTATVVSVYVDDANGGTVDALDQGAPPGGDNDRRRFLRQCAAVPLLTTISSTSAHATASVEEEGLSLVTRSDLGTSVRRAAVRGARVADRLDERWERYSDARRDKKKCDPNTNRRLFDNGFRKDGTRVGDPVLGALCDPEPLAKLEAQVAERVLGCARAQAGSLLSGDVRAVEDTIAAVGRQVGPSFTRAAATAVTTTTTTAVTTDQEKEQIGKRRLYNQQLYTHMRACGDLLLGGGGKDAIPPKRQKEIASKFELEWGRRLLSSSEGILSEQDLAVANRVSFKTPFPTVSPEEKADLAYDEPALLDALGSLSVSLKTLQSAGLVGHWEISIPYDDFGEVVTVAVDDDVSIGAQLLLREQRQGSAGNIGNLSGCSVIAIIRASLDNVGIACGVDSFFIDPSTTKQDIYDPSQLLVNLSNIRTK